MFTHQLLERFETEKKPIDGKRHYRLPSGVWAPSVTTVLSSKPKPELDAWKAAVGEERATAVTNRASSRGTIFHNICEAHLKNEVVPKNRYPLSMREQYEGFKKELDKNVDLVYGLELFTFSARLKIAGQTDCVCKWGTTNSILDHKTSVRPKPESWIEDYFLQSTAYSLMVEEMYGISVPQIVVMISVENDPTPQVFVKQRSVYVSALKERIEQFYDGAGK